MRRRTRWLWSTNLAQKSQTVNLLAFWASVSRWGTHLAHFFFSLRSNLIILWTVLAGTCARRANSRNVICLSCEMRLNFVNFHYGAASFWVWSPWFVHNRSPPWPELSNPFVHTSITENIAEGGMKSCPDLGEIPVLFDQKFDHNSLLQILWNFCVSLHR